MRMAIATDVYYPQRNGEYHRQRFGVPKIPVVLYTGRLSEEKRVDVLIKAMPYVLREMQVYPGEQ